MSLTEPLRALRNRLGAGLVERDLAVRLALLGALAGEHLLLIGPPGTGKSLVARRLRAAFGDVPYFERLLTRFTVPEELFGPLSIKGLQEDRYERVTASYLPTAAVAFLDEVFKANSAILNALLTLLNEREFDNGARRERTPLVALVGASNELPEGEELDALYDRFLLRLHVGPVSDQGFPQLLALRGESTASVPAEHLLGVDALRDVQQRAEGVDVPADVVTLLTALRQWCAAEKIPVSDRRWRKVVKLLQVSALTNGRMRVSVWDCWLLQHCVWNEPEQHDAVRAWYEARVGASAAMDPSQLTALVVAWESRLQRDQESRSQARDEKSRLLYKGADGKATPNTKGRFYAVRGSETLYLAPQPSWKGQYEREPINDRTNGGNGYTRQELNNLWAGYHEIFQHWGQRDTYLANNENRLVVENDLQPLMEPTRHKPAYLDECLRNIDDLRGQVSQYRDQLDDHVRSMEQEIRGHLWVTADFVEPASRSLAQTSREVATLFDRIDRVRTGFRMLPREADPAASPASNKGSTGKQR